MNSNQESCVGKMPCAKFAAALFVTIACMIFGMVMIGLDKNGALVPFYSSLISGSLTFWAHPPSYRNEVNSDGIL